MIRSDFYKVKRGNNLGDPEFWNLRFQDIDYRLAAREADADKIDNAVDQLTAVALQRLNDTFTPIIETATERLASVGALFSAESFSTNTIGGTDFKNFTLTPETRDAYVVTQYVSIKAADSPTSYFIGEVVSYDRTTGVMVVNPIAGYVVGSGSYDSWIISVTAPPDFDAYTRAETDSAIAAHTSLINNPHSVTAAQVGAYTTAQTTSAIAAHTSLTNNPHAVTAAQVGAYTQAQTDSTIAATRVLGSGRLEYVSATALKFAPFNGNKIKINGALYTIPNAGIAGLGNTGVFVNGVAGQNLAASTVYWVFAFNNSGTITVDFRTAATHGRSVTAGNEGVEILTANDTRSLIGMIRTNVSSQFQDDSASRFVRSWFNRTGMPLFYNLGVTRTTTGAMPSNTGDYIYWLNWADEAVWFSGVGYASNSVAATIWFGFYVDTVFKCAGQFFAATINAAIMIPTAVNLGYMAEGFHSLQLAIGTTGGTQSLFGGGYTTIAGGGS